MSEYSEHDLPAVHASQRPRALSRLHRMGRILPMLAMGGALVLAMLWTMRESSPVRAAITPPYTPDFTAMGEGPLQQFGFSVASAGDVNNDTFGDVIVGAPLAGKAYIYTGSVSGLSEPAFFTATGASGQFGYSVAGGGDLSGDGFGDFVVSAPISSTGRAFVYHGASPGLPTLAVTLTGILTDDDFGWSVDIIGDVNNDGLDDLAVGAPAIGISNTGHVYVYHGDPAGVAITPSIVLSGEAESDLFGVSVAAAGDVDGDGIDDLVVGALGSGEGGSEAGKAYVFYGSPSGLSQVYSTSVIGVANDKLGTSVHGAGDVNGDGFDDVIIGADAFNPGDPSPGRAFIYPGGPAGLITTTLFTALGESNNDRYAIAVTGDGDLDGDGFADFAVGARDFDTTPPITTTDEGKAYGYLGCTDGTIAPSLAFSDTGEALLNGYGRSLAIVGDVNGDGADDLVVGALGFQLSTGKIYAYYGVPGGGCRAQVELTKTVGLANYPAIYTNTAAITVPVGTAVSFSYEAGNTGNMTMTRHNLQDSVLGNTPQSVYTLTPGANVLVTVTDTVSEGTSPGISVTNVATWTASLSITSPSGVTTPTNRAILASAVASATVNVSGPTTDQDGDTIPDNVERSGDADGDQIPNYLDTDADGDGYSDAEEAGDDPTNPVDRDGDGIPSYLDPDENPTNIKAYIYMPKLGR